MNRCVQGPYILPDLYFDLSFYISLGIKLICFVCLFVCLFVFQTKQTKLLGQYVLSLAKYDQNYDVRDRARFLKQLLLPVDSVSLVESFYLVCLCNQLFSVLHYCYLTRNRIFLETREAKVKGKH